MTKRYLLTLGLVILGCASANTPAGESRAEVVDYVQRAAKLVERHGAGACDKLRQRDWYNDDWYVFVLDAQGRTVCHPARPEMVGRPSQELIDAAGKRFGDEFMQVAEQGGGWVDYLWPRPNASTPERKSSYLLPVKTRAGERYIVGSGGHSVH
ncbi:MAG TPA: cache domain-containing protein [Thermoanaerobaculia bacterium]|nr:cache domain-containing protein [Thermoanaerobaculia bacterium]